MQQRCQYDDEEEGSFLSPPIPRDQHVCDDRGCKLNLEQTLTTMAMATAMSNAMAMGNAMADVKYDGNVTHYGNMAEDN